MPYRRSYAACPCCSRVEQIPFEEFRDLWAAEETQKGLVGLMQRMILRLLNALVAMLAERRARRHEAEAQSAGSKACDADVEPAAADVCVADTEIWRSRRGIGE
jgi:hypothetical protein